MFFITPKELIIKKKKSTLHNLVVLISRYLENEIKYSGYISLDQNNFLLLTEKLNRDELEYLFGTTLDDYSRKSILDVVEECHWKVISEKIEADDSTYSYKLKFEPKE